MSDTLLQYLLNGDVLGFILGCFTDVLGQAFFGMVLLFFSVLFYNRTKSVPFVSIIWILVGGLFEFYTWEFSMLAVLLMIGGIAGIVYSLFEKEGA